MIYNRFTLSLLIVLFACLTGCGDQEWGYVEGVVTLEGQPVGPGTLIFEPMGTNQGKRPSAVGYLDAQGKYTLGGGKKKGASVGEYQVTIVGGDAESFAEERRTSDEAKSSIPKRYQNPEAGLTASVVPGKQVINFELTTQNKRSQR